MRIISGGRELGKREGYMASPKTVWIIATAPLLVVVLWLLLDSPGEVVEQRSQEPQAVTSFPLMELPSCRQVGEKCGLYNGDFKVAFAITPEGQLRISSSRSLDYVLVGLASAGDQQPDVAQPVDTETRDRWVFNFEAAPESTDRLRLVTVVGETTWFGEASLTFLSPRD